MTQAVVPSAAPDQLREARARIQRRRFRIMKLMILLTPVVAYLMSEAYFASRFSADFPGTTLTTQGAWRFLVAPCRMYRNNPTYVRRLDNIAYRYNNVGLRHEEDITPQKPAGEFRVFVLGGSTAYGERASDLGQWKQISGQLTMPTSDTIAAYLEQELQGKIPGRKVKAYTAATVAYRTHQSYQTYLELLRGLDPDLIVTLDGMNEQVDLENPYSFEMKPPAYQSGGALVKWLRQHSYTLLYVGEWFRASELFDRVTGRNRIELTDAQMAAMDYQETRKKVHGERDAYAVNEKVAAGLMHVYDQFNHACHLDGVPVLFMVQPILAIDDTHNFTEMEQRLLKYWLFKYHRPLEYYLWNMDKRLTAKAAKDPEFRYLSGVDAYKDFEGDAYTDYCHLTPKANHHLAKKIAERVLADPVLRAGCVPPPR